MPILISSCLNIKTRTRNVLSNIGTISLYRGVAVVPMVASSTCINTLPACIICRPEMDFNIEIVISLTYIVSLLHILNACGGPCAVVKAKTKYNQ